MRASLAEFLTIALIMAMTALAPSAHAQEQAVVPLRVIYPGETVSADALDEIYLNRPPRGVVVRVIEEIEGKVAKRTLLPGRLIPPRYVRDAYLVETGEPVTVVFSEGALTISARAVPLQSGAVGDMIRLRNLDSGRTFMGIVLRDGTVQVSAG